MISETRMVEINRKRTEYEKEQVKDPFWVQVLWILALAVLAMLTGGILAFSVMAEHCVVN